MNIEPNRPIITIKNTTYERACIHELKDGDIVLATYIGASEVGGRTRRGGYFFETAEWILTDGDERIYNRVQRWEVERESFKAFHLKRAKSGTKTKYSRVLVHHNRNHFVYREVK